MKGLCSEFLRPNHRLLAALPAPFAIVPNADLQTVCRAFVDLQARRHAADYDLSARFNRSQALQMADQADEAMQSWDRAVVAAPDLLQTFAICLSLWPSLASH